MFIIIIAFPFILGMLLWICDQKVISSSTEGNLITQSGLLTDFREEILDVLPLNALKQYFTTDAWMAVEQRGKFAWPIVESELLVYSST